MKRKLFAVAFFMGFWGAYCQVGIGTRSPNVSSELDVVSKDKGVLIPRVPLTSAKDTKTIKGNDGNGYENSLLVFNTLTQNDVTPGYYYWYQDRWMRILDEGAMEQYLNKYGGNVHYDGTTLTFVNENGDTVTIDLSTIIQAGETLTTLVRIDEGKYEYTNEAGTKVVIDVMSDVTNNFEEIINRTDVQEILNQYITENGGNIHYDGDSFTYVDENGQTVSLDMTTIVKGSETVTTLVKDPLNNGKYTYTNEAGLAVVIDVQADVSNNFEEIINRTDVQEILNQYITENGGNIHYDGDSFTYVDENGQTVSLDMTTIVKGSETVTTLVKDPLNNGKYTYTNEAGLAVVIDVQADVSNNFEEIINRTEVQEILNQYITENGGNIHYDGDSFTYVDENGQTVSLDMTTIVKGSETVTTLVKDPLNNGKYTYTNEAGLAVVIDVQADVSNNFEEIINRTDVQEILNQYITENGGNIHYDGDSFTYVDENGQTVSLDMTTIVKGSETVTTLVKDPLNNGKYTYTNEAGLAVVIDVQADVSNNFEEIINRTDVQEILNQYITENGGNIHYDGDSFTYVDENGQTVSLDMTTIVKGSETLTTLVKDPLNNGKYTYTNEAGLAVVIDVQADVSNNFEEIINRTDVQEILNQYITENGGNIHYDGDSFTYVDENGQTVSLDMTTIVKGSETVTTLVKDPLNNGKYTYTNEAGLAVVIDVQADVSNNFEEIINRTEVQEILNQYITENGGNIHYDGDSFTYVDENGQTVSLDMTTIVKGSETLTTLVKDPLNNGKYTYTNEAGLAVVIDVQADVSNNFEEIINRTEVQEILNQYITENGGNIHYDGDSFTYVDENGQTVSLDMNTIVKGSETVTTLVKDPLNNGKYTYMNESGAEVVIDVQADVINNFEEIINNTEVQELLTQVINNNGGNVHFDGDSMTYTDENGASQTVDLTALIQASETVTTLVKDPLNNGKYTYTNESGAAVVIDVQADVINNFEEIINNTEVQELLTQVINNNGGNVHFDGDSMTYTDENGASQTVDLTALIQASETVTTLVKDPLNSGKYTYTNEAGLAVVIDVQADVSNNFEEIINRTDVQEILNQYITENGGNIHYDGDSFTYVDENGQTVSLDMSTIVKGSETLTTLVKDPLNSGKYTYTNEAGLAVVIDVQADVSNNFEEIINRTEVQEILNQYITENGGNIHYDGDSFTYVDENGQTVSLDMTTIVKGSETVTTLVKDPLNNGKYTYTNESGAEVVIDVQADVINNFEEIINNTEVQELLTQVINNNGGNVHFDGDSMTYTDENGASQTVDLTALIQASETVTTLVKDPLNNGKYTYTNESGAEVVIDVQADVINNFEEIINNTEVQELLTQVVSNTGGNMTYDGTGFTYVDENGQTVSLDMSTIVKGSETLTTLVKDPLNNGKYTYTNEAGLAVVIDVQADVSNNFEEIINRTEVQEILNQYITENGGNIHYDGDSFTYVDENGQTVSLDMSTIVKGSETVTTLVKDPLNNGKYTYTNEAGLAVVIDVQADVSNNFEEIINRTDVQEILNQYITENGGNIHYDGDSFTYVDENGQTVSLDMSTIVKGSETVTTLVKDPLNNGKYTYTNESGAAVVIDVQADVINNFEEIINNTEVQELLTQVINNNGGNVHFDGDSMTYTDENGASQTVDLTALIQASETVTTLVKDPLNNGKYTYTNESGAEVVIDVQADVINNFEEIINNTEVQELLTQVVSNTGGNMTYDGTGFTYVDENGDTVSIDMSAFIKDNETTTTLVKDASGNGKYTYTNETSTAVELDVPADVISNFETIVTDSNVKSLLQQAVIKANTLVEITSNYVVLDEDTTIMIDAEVADVAITLPAATPENKGRMILIRRIDESDRVVSFSQQIKTSKTEGFTSINYGMTVHIQSNGTAWYMIN
ncbi:hypothetical protein QNH98_04045 [Myroides sp. mNGS23_01]|nr:hypothetical protein [Myroides sp. mNGS23_01]WHT39856.1 hypothetical protein QNH98_04045 [Myroides sp. mNGS23_01]